MGQDYILEHGELQKIRSAILIKSCIWNIALNSRYRSKIPGTCHILCLPDVNLHSKKVAINACHQNNFNQIYLLF